MKTKRFFSLLLMAVALCCWTGCSDDNDTDSKLDNDISNAASRATREDSVRIATQLVYQRLCVTDTAMHIKLSSGVDEFQPCYGAQLYDVTPTVRYVSANSLADARQMFITEFQGAITYLNADTTAVTIRLDLGQQGYICFLPEGSDGHVAKIEVSLKQLDRLTEVCFLQDEAWPQNAVNSIAQGNTFLSTDGHNFICIKNAENQAGLMVTFDLGWDRLLNNDGYIAQRHDPTLGEWPNAPDNLPGRYPWHSYIFFSHDGMIRSNQLYYLQGFLYEEGRQNKNSKEALKRIATDRVVDLLYGVGKIYLCSDGCWLETETKHKYEDVLYYNMKKEKVCRDDIKRDYIWFSMRFFIMHPTIGECRCEDWQANSFNIRKNWITQSNFRNGSTPQPYNCFNHETEYSWNYRCGYELDNFIRVRCFEFYQSFDYQSAGLVRTDRFNRKTNF